VPPAQMPRNWSILEIAFEDFWIDGNSCFHFTQFSAQIRPHPRPRMGSNTSGP
jgi:hypothetical protein